MIPHSLKQTVLQTACLFGADRFFRFLNRKKLLVVMYHGITAHQHTPPIWTQLPLELFRNQLKFLSSHYQPVTLNQVTAAIHGEQPLPERAVLITFDDGLSNNYSCAFPLLQQMGIPATIFLTVDLISSEELLWFDELLFLLQQADPQRSIQQLDNQAAVALLQAGKLWPAYQLLVEELKRCGSAYRTEIMKRLRAEIHLNRAELKEDFGLLTWEEIRTMHRSGLISFGVHTATHRILTELPDTEWDQEIVKPKLTLEKQLNSMVSAFCFPNGRPGYDFYPYHLVRLRRAGYRCAFSTENALFDWSAGERLSITRIPAGNDATSDPACFSLNTSGALPFIKGWRTWPRQNDPLPLTQAA